MAVVTAMPSEAIIGGFKGSVDFYYYMGLAVARKWPKKIGRLRSEAVTAQWSPFAVATREWSNLSPEVQASYNSLCIGSRLSGRDMQQRAYLSGLYRYPLP